MRPPADSYQSVTTTIDRHLSHPCRDPPATQNKELSGSLARLLATADPPVASDAARALTLAGTLERDNPENVETMAMALAAAGRFEEATAAQQVLVDAARGRTDPGLVRHLEHNLERYRRGQPSDQLWMIEEAGAEGLSS